MQEQQAGAYQNLEENRQEMDCSPSVFLLLSAAYMLLAMTAAGTHPIAACAAPPAGTTTHLELLAAQST
eukprot:1160769-Pelagomonas_calceolata.AAC.7